MKLLLNDKKILCISIRKIINNQKKYTDRLEKIENDLFDTSSINETTLDWLEKDYNLSLYIQQSIEQVNKPLFVYSDGSCSLKKNIGGWSAIISEDPNLNSIVKIMHGKLKGSTNNNMELKGPTMALKYILRETPVTIYTDSQYVKKGIENWIHKWRNNGWKTNSGQPIKNINYWAELYDECSGRQVNWEWVKGHSKNYGNNFADSVASNGIRGE